MGNTSTSYCFVKENEGIKTFPCEIMSKKDTLLTLSLSGNNLKVLPPEIGRLKSLLVLSISQNKLNKLPNTIGCLTSLKELNLSSNRLVSLPSEVGLLKSVITLHLENNQLEKLPTELGNLSLLQQLFVHNNKLSDIPVQVCQLTKLEWLSYDDSVSFPRGCPRPTDNLKAFKHFMRSNSCNDLRQMKPSPISSSKFTSSPTLLRSINPSPCSLFPHSKATSLLKQCTVVHQMDTEEPLALPNTEECSSVPLPVEDLLEEIPSPSSSLLPNKDEFVSTFLQKTEQVSKIPAQRERSSSAPQPTLSYCSSPSLFKRITNALKPPHSLHNRSREKGKKESTNDSEKSTHERVFFLVRSPIVDTSITPEKAAQSYEKAHTETAKATFVDRSPQTSTNTITTETVPPVNFLSFKIEDR